MIQTTAEAGVDAGFSMNFGVVTIAGKMMAEQRMRANQSTWQSPDSGLMRAANNASQGTRAAAQPTTTTTRRLGRRQRQPGDSAIDPTALSDLEEENTNDDEDWEDGIQSYATRTKPPHRENSAQSRQPNAGRSPLPATLKSSPKATQQTPHTNAPIARQQRQSGASNRQLELPTFAEQRMPSGGSAAKALPEQPREQQANSLQQLQAASPEHRVASSPPAQRSSPPIANARIPNMEIGEESTLESGVDADSPQSVWMQIQRVNQLSAELETALLDLRSLSLAAQPDYLSAGDEGAEPDQLRWEAETAVVPYVQPEMDAYVVRTRPVDLAQVQPTIVARGRSSSHRANNPYLNPPTHQPIQVPQPAFPPAVPFTALDPPYHGQPARTARRSRPDWLMQLLQPPTTTLGLLNDALSWVVGAGIVRVGLELLRMVHPALWTPALLVLLAVLIWGVYRGLTGIQSKPILAYRLVLIVVGLVLGGKFWTR